MTEHLFHAIPAWIVNAATPDHLDIWCGPGLMGPPAGAPSKPLCLANTIANKAGDAQFDELLTKSFSGIGDKGALYYAYNYPYSPSFLDVLTTGNPVASPLSWMPSSDASYQYKCWILDIGRTPVRYHGFYVEITNTTSKPKVDMNIWHHNGRQLTNIQKKVLGIDLTSVDDCLPGTYDTDTVSISHLKGAIYLHEQVIHGNHLDIPKLPIGLGHRKWP
jgi:hypothetical protein